MNFKHPLFSLAALLVFSTLSFAQSSTPAAQIHALDTAITARLRQTGVKHETERAILWVEKDSLAQKEIEKSMEALWLAEGYVTYIQTYVAAQNGGYDFNPHNVEKADIDQSARDVMRTELGKKLLPLIGLNGIPGKMNAEEREIFRPIFEDRRVTAKAFYILSTSFVKFLIEKIGLKKLEKSFDSADTQANIRRITGKKVDDWKAEWLNSLAG